MPKKSREPTRYVLVLFQARNHTGGYRTISRGLVTNVQRKLDAVIKTPKDRTQIEIWLDSPGGDAHSAYKLMLELRQRCSRLTAVVPDVAKSAATLLLLGVDEIAMAPAAELGPLDVQIAHPDREDQVISGLDVQGSLSYLSQFAIGLILSGGAALIEATELPRLDVLKSMENFTAHFLQPCVSKLDPHLTRRAVYQLKVAERYAIALLKSRNVPKEQQLNGDKAQTLVRELVNSYPVHEFLISREEASSLGLPITPAELHRHWYVIKQVHDEFLKGKDSIIKVFEEPKPTKSDTKRNTKTATANGTKPKTKHTTDGAKDDHTKDNSRSSKSGPDSGASRADFADALAR